MKKTLLLATAFVFAMAGIAQQTSDSVNKQTADAVIKVATEKHDFGKIKQGIPVDYYFEIKNISDKPIVVENSWASCGCTTPEKITEPIMPGATTKLKVQFNAAAVAVFAKDVYVKLAGVDQPKTLHISGEVLSVEAYDTYVKEKGDNKGKTKDNNN